MDLGKLMEGVSKIQSLPEEEKQWLLETTAEVARRHMQITDMGIAQMPDDRGLEQRKKTLQVVLDLLSVPAGPAAPSRPTRKTGRRPARRGPWRPTST